MNQDPESLARRLMAQADQFIGRGDYRRALAAAERAFDICRSQLGGRHPLFGSAAARLGTLCRSLGRFPEAVSFFCEALENCRTAFGTDHPNYAACLSNLGGAYEALGDLPAARPLYTEAVEIAGRTIPDHPHHATCLNNLGLLCFKCGEYERAEQLFQQAYQIDLHALPRNHPELATDLNNLAGLFQAAGRFTEAETAFKQALDITATAYGEEHPETAIRLNNLAMLYQAMARNSKAEQFFEQALGVWGRSLGKHHPLYATAVNNLARLRIAQGRFQEAESQLQESLSIRQNAFGEDHAEVAINLKDLAVLHMTMGRYDCAEALLQKSLAIGRDLLGPRHPDVADGLTYLSDLCRQQGRYQVAERLCREAVEIWKATVGENHPAFAQSLVGLASICHAVGRYPEAETLAQQALRIEQGHGLVRADTLTSLASVLESLGRYEQAEGILRRAIETTRAALGEEHPEFATSLNNLGLLCRTTGHFGEAGRLLQQALEIRRKTLGDCHPLVATSLNSLADLHLATGDYVEAEREFHKALELRRSLLGNRHVDVATSLSNLAALYLDLGDDVGGEALMVEALQIRRMTLGEAHPHVALLLNNLACVYLARGDRARAQEHFERALSIRMDVLGESHPLCAESLGGRAAVHWMAGEYNDAEQRYRRVLAIFREVYGEQHPLAAKTAASLGALYYANGRYELAESHLQQSLASQRSGLADQHPDIVSTLRHLGAVCAATTRTTEALRLLREAAALEDRTIGQGLAIGSERQRLGFLQSAELHVHMFLSLVWRLMPDSAEAVGAALDLIFRRKGVGMEALASQRSAILCGRYPHLKGQLYDLDSLRMQIAQQTLDGPGLEPVDIHRQRLAEWNARREWLEAELARQIPELNLEMRLREANCHTVAAALPPGSVLIDFIRFHQFDFHAVPARGEAQWKPPRYLAFVLTAGKPSDVRMIDLGEAEKLEGLVADYRAAVTGQGAQRGVSVVPAKMVDQRTLAASRTLCAAVFDRLTPPVGSSRRLLIAPDGDLCRLPFETLPLENGRYVIDEYQVSYLGCGRDALRFGTQTSGHASEPLVVADPDFDLAAPAPAADQPQAAAHHRRSRDLDPQTLRFERLPGTRVEGERIGTLLGVRPWLGGMALDGRLKSRCRSPRILHLATHGFFLENQRNEPNKQPGPWGAIASGATTTGRLSGPFLENPLLRSGLALAGAETWRQGGRPPAEAEDGLLTAEDVSRLDLSATELAVLSACDTGLGEIRTGEGVFGLRRAFILAGARTLVMSLWKVPDDQTQELMIDFHRRLLAGESRAESLRQAQLSLKARHPNAYYWGAFICQGVP